MRWDALWVRYARSQAARVRVVEVSWRGRVRLAGVVLHIAGIHQGELVERRRAARRYIGGGQLPGSDREGPLLHEALLARAQLPHVVEAAVRRVAVRVEVECACPVE